MKNKVSVRQLISYIKIVILLLLALSLLTVEGREFVLDYITGIIELETENLLSLIGLVLSVYVITKEMRPTSIYVTISTGITGVKRIPDESDILHLPLIFYTVGNRANVIKKVELVIVEDISGKQSIFEWSTFCDTSRQTWIPGSKVVPFLVNANESMNNVITFLKTEGDNLELSKGKYKVKINIWSDKYKIPHSYGKFTLNIDDKLDTEIQSLPPGNNFDIEVSNIQLQL